MGATYAQQYYRDHKDDPSWIANRYTQNKRFRQARQEVLKLMKSYPCMDCGHSFPPECMDFDHVRGEKLLPVARFFTGSMRRLRAEIAKCELVCANCHRTRTKNRV